MRDRLRQNLAVARSRARDAGDVNGEEREWKAFGLIPMMLLRTVLSLDGKSRRRITSVHPRCNRHLRPSRQGSTESCGGGSSCPRDMSWLEQARVAGEEAPTTTDSSRVPQIKLTYVPILPMGYRVESNQPRVQNGTYAGPRKNEVAL